MNDDVAEMPMFSMDAPVNGMRDRPNGSSSTAMLA